MSTVMLICAAVAVAAILTSLRYLPGRASSGDASGASGASGAPAARPPATAEADAGTRR
jgi:hypothetical protein